MPLLRRSRNDKGPHLEDLRREYRIFLHDQRGYTSEQLDELRCREVSRKPYNEVTYQIVRVTDGSVEHVTTLGKITRDGKIVEYDAEGRMVTD
jgi:hypothetical protein